MRKLFVFTIIISSLVLSGCIFKKSVVENEKSKAGNQQSEAVDADGWKTYQNTEYGFEFKYPKNLNIEESDNKFPDQLGLAFFPEDKEKHTEVAENLGALSYTSNQVSDSAHLTNSKNFNDFREFITGNSNEEQAVFDSNGISWFCFVPAKANDTTDIKLKKCYTEQGDKNFYQMSFNFSPATIDYFSIKDMDKLVKSFKFIK
ncbi:MAG: hypothetical protein WCV41_03420 [Patescibacteria group bacterium]